MGYIGPYEVIQELSNKDAGSSEWGFVRKDEVEYYIKRFLSPKYPVEQKELDIKFFIELRAKAEAFYKEKSAFYNVLKDCQSGNNIIVRDFFRDNSFYYAVTDRVTRDSISIEQIARFNEQQKIVLTSAILYSIMLVHEHGLVHADIKPDNLITKKTKRGYYTAKIVDFDAGFFAAKPPEKEKLGGDLVYWAPETYLRSEGEDAVISEKIDIFALGLLLHQYWSGHLPYMGGEPYAFLYVLNEGPLEADKSIPPRVRGLITRMVDVDPANRPSAKHALARLTNRMIEPEYI